MCLVPARTRHGTSPPGILGSRRLIASGKAGPAGSRAAPHLAEADIAPLFLARILALGAAQGTGGPYPGFGFHGKRPVPGGCAAPEGIGGEGRPPAGRRASAGPWRDIRAAEGGDPYRLALICAVNPGRQQPEPEKPMTQMRPGAMTATGVSPEPARSFPRRQQGAGGHRAVVGRRGKATRSPATRGNPPCPGKSRQADRAGGRRELSAIIPPVSIFPTGICKKNLCTLLKVKSCLWLKIC